MQLQQYVEVFLSRRDVSDTYRFQVRLRARQLEEFAGRALLVGELTCELVNAWLMGAKRARISPYTVNTYRANVLAVWNSAYQDRLIETPPLRVMRIRKPRLIVEAYTHAEIRQLLTTCTKLRSKMRNGNRRADFWRAFIHAAYSTGLRRGDLLRLFRRDVAEDGTLRVVQSKTAEPIRVQLSAEALCYSARLTDRNNLLLPWPYRLDAMTWAFRRIRNRAGIQRGSLKWIRRSAGSYAEAKERGAGRRLLGHRTDTVFALSYDDPTITRADPVTPPPLPE